MNHILGKIMKNYLFLACCCFFTASHAVTQWISDIEPNPLEFTEFGEDIAIMNGWLIVGDPFNDDVGNNAGAIHVYQDINGQWTLFQSLYPQPVDVNDSLDNDELGSSVAIEENHITGEIWIVGAALRDDELNLDTGAVYLFNYVDQGSGVFAFEFQEKLIGESFLVNTNFGSSVDINLDYIEEIDSNEWVLVIGDDGKYYNLEDDSIPPNVTRTKTGGVNVYKKNDGIFDTNWVEAPVQTGQIYLNGLTGNDFIGRSVAIDGKFIVAGAPGDDDHNLGTDGAEMGAIHILTRDGLTQTWACCSIIYPDNRVRSANFGTSVDVIKQPGNNRVIMGGAPFEDSNIGSVYVWYNGLQVQRLQPQITNQLGGEFFGASISANGDSFLGDSQFIIGSPYSDTDKGIVYQYVRNDSFDGGNDYYLLKDTVVAYDRDDMNSVWNDGRFGTQVATDGRTHAAASRANRVGNHSKVYTQEHPIFINGYESLVQQ